VAERAFRDISTNTCLHHSAFGEVPAIREREAPLPAQADATHAA
jgi:hypothetical protein